MQLHGARLRVEIRLGVLQGARMLPGRLVGREPPLPSREGGCCRRQHIRYLHMQVVQSEADTGEPEPHAAFTGYGEILLQVIMWLQ